MRRSTLRYAPRYTGSGREYSVARDLQLPVFVADPNQHLDAFLLGAFR